MLISGLLKSQKPPGVVRSVAQRSRAFICPLSRSLSSWLLKPRVSRANVFGRTALFGMCGIRSYSASSSSGPASSSVVPPTGEKADVSSASSSSGLASSSVVPPTGEKADVSSASSSSGPLSQSDFH